MIDSPHLELKLYPLIVKTGTPIQIASKEVVTPLYGKVSNAKSIFVYSIKWFLKFFLNGNNFIDESTLLDSNFFNNKLEDALLEPLRMSFEFLTFFNIVDQVLITSSFIFLKLLNDPKVMWLLFLYGGGYSDFSCLKCNGQGITKQTATVKAVYRISF